MKETPENKILRDACIELHRLIDELIDYDIRTGSVETWLEMAMQATMFAADALSQARRARRESRFVDEPAAKDLETIELIERFAKLGMRVKQRPDECMLCSEAITAEDRRAPSTVNGGPAHIECVIRGTMGGANHIRKLCRSFGGTLDEDPPGLTFRQAAIEAYKAWQETLH